VRGCNAVIVDDFTTTGSTLASAADELLARGARSVCAAVTHGVFGEGSVEVMEASPLRVVLCTDTVETQPVRLPSSVRVVSIAPLLAEAIRRIHARESISSLFA
jgi:ribose-phosphate pyrophosphokinase